MYATKVFDYTLPNWATYNNFNNIFSLFSLDPTIHRFYVHIMSDMEDILPEDSVSQARSTALNPSSRNSSSWKRPPIPPGVQIIDQCIVVENTPECLNTLVEHFKMVSFLNESIDLRSLAS